MERNDMTEETAEQATIRESIQEVLSRIRRTAARRGKTDLPTADFSNALNAIGENFVDLLFSIERRGQWWLDEQGQFHDCIVRRVGDRYPRNFARGVSPEWNWYPEAATRLADPMTGPDHVVSVSVPSLEIDGSVCLEQKLRFGTRRDAFAGASTYLKHLLHRLDFPRPSKKEFKLDSYFNGLLEAAKAVLCRTKKDGRLAYSGSVPQVCFVSTGLQPNKVFVPDKAGVSNVECDYVGFLAPTIDSDELTRNLPAAKIMQRAKVRLWIGLDSLIEGCTNEEVEGAWSTAVAQLTEDVRNPSWCSDYLSDWQNIEVGESAMKVTPSTNANDRIVWKGTGLCDEFTAEWRGIVLYVEYLDTGWRWHVTDTRNNDVAGCEDSGGYLGSSELAKEAAESMARYMQPER